MTQNETHDNGMKVRREVLGDEYVSVAVEKTTPVTADFQDFITHVEGALRNGLTEDEIKEVFLQGAIYCGVPAANAAFAVARRAFANRGKQES